MIFLDGVSKFFITKNGRHYVLNNVTLEIPSGVNVGVIGPNGAGKSTLMRLIAGVDIPNKGSVYTSYDMSWPMGLACGVQGGMTGRENSHFVCRILGTKRSETQEKLDYIKNFSELGKYFEMPVKTYSSGMRARLTFAISMAFDFDCYIIDELTAVGDKKFRNKSKEVFLEKRKNANFIKVSHSMKELKEECDSGLLLCKGSLTYFPDIDDAIDVYESI